jgi:putative inorganic carbon (hco3(-)) transporter
MPQKPHIADYEPVTRTATPNSFDDTNREDFSRESKGRPDAVEIPKNPPPIEPTRTRQGRDEKTLKRGHAASFAGVFLFTVVVYFRPYELFSWLSWASSMAFVIAILTLIIYVPTQLGLEGNLTTRPREINCVLLLLLTGLVSIPLAFNKTAAFFGFNEFLKVVLMFIVMVNVLRTEKRLRAMLLLALITSCIVSAAAVNDYRLGLFLRDLANNRIRGSIGNLFDNPNDLALHLVTMVPLAFGMLLASRGGLKKLFFAGCTVLIIVGDIATFSRGGFIGLVCVGAVLAWRLAKSNKFLIATGLPIALLLFLLFAPGGYRSRIASTTDDSGIARREELKRSLFVAIHHPLFGVGINNYILFSDVNHATHNAYTQVASEMGFPALLIYVLFLITPLKGLRRISRATSASRHTSRYYYLAVGLEASLVGYMVSSFFLSVAYLWYVYYLVGYAICFRRLYDASQVEEKSEVRFRNQVGESETANRSPELRPAQLSVNR